MVLKAGHDFPVQNYAEPGCSRIVQQMVEQAGHRHVMRTGVYYNERGTSCDDQRGRLITIASEMDSQGIVCLRFQTGPESRVGGDQQDTGLQAKDTFIISALGAAALRGAKRPGAVRPAVGSQDLETPC